MGGTYSTHGRNVKRYKILIGDTEETDRRWWDANIKIGLKEIQYEDWTGITWLMLGSSGGFLQTR
jgi:hypothetical protein